MTGQVDLQVTRAHEVALGILFGNFRPPQHRPDPGDEFLRAEGFGHVIVRAEFQPEDFIGLLVPRGKDDHRNGGFLAQAARDIQPVDIRQAQIDDQQIRIPFMRGGKGLASVRGGQDLESGLDQIVTDQVRDFAFVVHYQDGFHGASGRLYLRGLTPIPIPRRGETIPAGAGHFL